MTRASASTGAGPRAGQRPSWRWVMVAVLAALSASHLARGLYYLAVQHPAGAVADLRNRRIETAYFLDRVSPLSQQMLALQPHDPGPLTRGADTRWSHGVEHAHGALPPWTYPLQLAVVPPLGEDAARVYLACLDIASLAGVMWMAYRRAAATGAAAVDHLLVVLSPLAVGATDNALTQGQNSLVVNGALALLLIVLTRARDRARDSSAGVAFALAMMKPSSALLMALPPLAARRWLLLATAAVILVGATLGGAAWIRHPVSLQLEQFNQLSRSVVDEGAHPALNALVAATSAGFARNAFAVAGIAVASIAIVGLRRADVLAQFAVLAVVSRLFTYHRAYDDVLLVFLVVHLAARAVAAAAEATRWRAAWLVCGASLWLPYSLYVPLWAQWCQITVWSALAVAVYRWERACERGDSNPHSLAATGS